MKIGAVQIVQMNDVRLELFQLRHQLFRFPAAKEALTIGQPGKQRVAYRLRRAADAVAGHVRGAAASGVAQKRPVALPHGLTA